MFQKRIKHTQRFQEILNVFLKNGFSHFLFRIGLSDRPVSIKKQDTHTNMNLQDIGKKLRQTLQQLGPTFIKLGQIASTRRDLVPEEIAVELEKLQDDVQSISFDKVESIIKYELGDSLNKLFHSINTEPLATASIGQVHIATLFTGEEVAIKIQRPDIEPTIKTDLEILDDIARLLEEKFDWAKTYNIREMIEEFSYSLRDELDYSVEGRNAERIAKQFCDDEKVYIPTIFWDYCTKKVLTMERINGIKVSHIDKLDEFGYDRKQIAERITDAMFIQILENGFFHGDPHAGNIYIMPNNVIAFLDFGMIGRLNDNLKYNFASLIINLQRGNSKGMIKTFDAMGLIEETTNRDALHRDLDKLQAKYYDVSLKNISLGGVIAEIFSIAYRNEVTIPNDITILGKSVLTMEEIIKNLDPKFSIMQAIEPFGEKLIKDRFHPKNIAQHSWDHFVDNIELLADLPQDIKDITTTAKKGKFRFDINVTELPSFLKRLDRISNRLSFSIILLSFSILMVGLIVGASIAGQTNLLWRIPVIEIGSVIATLMFLFMIFTIIRSGRM